MLKMGEQKMIILNFKLQQMMFLKSLIKGIKWLQLRARLHET